MGAEAPGRRPSRLVALAQGLAATIIWAGGLLVVKMYLQHIDPFQFIAVRNVISAVSLLPLAAALDRRPFTPRLKPAVWARVVAMGICGFILFSGFMYVGLAHLPAVTVSFVLNFSPLVVLLLATVWLHERPSRIQVVGLAAAFLGGYLFFPADLSSGEIVGMGFLGISMVAGAVNSVLARQFATSQEMGALRLTALAMLVSAVFLGILLVVRGLPSMTWRDIALITVLALTTMTLANTIWLHIFKALKAFEASLLSNVMPIETALLGWVLMGQVPGIGQWAAMLVCAGGITVVQLHRYISRFFEARAGKRVMEERG